MLEYDCNKDTCRYRDPFFVSHKNFVVSMLYLMKRGLFVQGVEVFPKNHYLESVLPEANTLDTYDVHKPAFTQCKNNILRALREAFELDHRDPRSFIVNP